MGKVSDFIDGLEGQENLDLNEVVSELLKLHNEETETMTAKIASQESFISEANETIAARDEDVKKWKAKNWDLVNEFPAKREGTEPQINAETGLPDGSSITLDDMFSKG